MKTVLNVDFRICKGRKLSDHLQDLVDQYSVGLALIGTRKADPSGRWQSGCLAQTTPGWPKVLLASPIFRWSFSLIWEYTLNLDVPRCSLYDKGYTSLGPKCDTTPNDCLLIRNHQSSVAGKEGQNEASVVKSEGENALVDDKNVEEQQVVQQQQQHFEPAWRMTNFTQERENRKSRKKQEQDAKQ